MITALKTYFGPINVAFVALVVAFAAIACGMILDGSNPVHTARELRPVPYMLEARDYDAGVIGDVPLTEASADLSCKALIWDQSVTKESSTIENLPAALLYPVGPFMLAILALWPLALSCAGRRWGLALSYAIMMSLSIAMAWEAPWTELFHGTKDAAEINLLPLCGWATFLLLATAQRNWQSLAPRDVFANGRITGGLLIVVAVAMAIVVNLADVRVHEHTDVITERTVYAHVTPDSDADSSLPPFKVSEIDPTKLPGSPGFVEGSRWVRIGGFSNQSATTLEKNVGLGKLAMIAVLAASVFAWISLWPFRILVRKGYRTFAAGLICTTAVAVAGWPLIEGMPLFNVFPLGLAAGLGLLVGPLLIALAVRRLPSTRDSLWIRKP